MQFLLLTFRKENQLAYEIQLIRNPNAIKLYDKKGHPQVNTPCSFIQIYVLLL